MKGWIGRIETTLQNLIERTLERLAGARLDSAAIAIEMVRAMESSLRRDEVGRSWAPDEYSLRLHPGELRALQQETPDLVPLLKGAVLQAARDGGFSIEEEPHIVMVADYKMARNKVRVEAIHGADALFHTRQMPSLTGEIADAVEQAVLVSVEGDIYPLGEEEVSIGRLRDNHIVFDDPRVSRRHAEVRLRQGRHVIYDLGSKAGTRVNGEPKKQCILRHGDVITLAGNRLVYQLGNLGNGRASTNRKTGAGA